MTLCLFAPAQFGPHVAPLLDGITVCEIGVGTPDRSREAPLRNLTHAQLGGQRPLRDSTAADACLAGLWLLHGFLDRSHEISQAVHTADGSYWHGIMHRREGDYSNAKYWFRQAGPHAIGSPLAQQVTHRLTARGELPEAWAETEWSQRLADSTWDPHGFVDLVRQVERAGSSGRSFCEKIAWLEWQLLFQHCYEQAYAPQP